MKKKSIFVILLSLVMVLGLMPGISLMAYADEPAVTVLNEYMTDWESGTYKVPESGVTFEDSIYVSGEVTLILTDGTTLKVNDTLNINNAATLTIEGTGAMEVKGGYGTVDHGACDAIFIYSGGKLIMNNGSLTATGGNGGNGNGPRSGGYGISSSYGKLIMNGGELTATGGNGGNGNGPRSGGDGIIISYGNLTINGGNLTATGGNGGDGVPGGFGITGDVTVNGGTIIAIGGTNNSGIAGKVTINGGSLTAKGEDTGISGNPLTLGAGVALYKGTDNTGEVLDSNIDSSRVYSGVRYPYMYAGEPQDLPSDTDWGAGTYKVPEHGVTFENPINVSGDVTLILTEGATLYAKDGIKIYDGCTLTIEGNGTMDVRTFSEHIRDGISGDVIVNGGTVTATGGDAIGGGPCGSGIIGDVTVNGGTVTATSGNAAGVSNGGYGIWGDVIVKGGTVTATGGNAADGSSGGDGIYGDVTVNSGTVAVTGGNGGDGGLGIHGIVTVNGGTMTASGGNGGDGGNGLFGIVKVNGGKLTAKGGGTSPGIHDRSPLTLGAGVTLYKGTDNTGDVLDGNTDSSREYSGERYPNMYAEHHTHNFTYSASGATITAKCENEGCDIETGLALIISAPTDLTYDGKAKAATLNTDYNTTAFPDTYTIKYYQGETEVAAEDVKNVGDYTAKVTAGDATAEVSFTIVNPAPVYDAVDEAIDKINALREPYDEAKVKEAREAYDKLTPAQKEDRRFTEEVLKKLTDAEAAVKAAKDKEAADKVKQEIAAIPDDLSKATSDQVSGTVEAYNCLTDDQKKLITDDELGKLQKALNYPATKLKASLKSVKAKKGRKAVIKWKAKTAANGYQLYYKAKGVKAKKVNINDPKTVTKTIKKLKAGKKYSFKIRTVTEVQNLAAGGSMKVYGQWSKVKKVKAKK